MSISSSTLPPQATRDAAIDDIREHYDTLSPLYRTFWGEHLHHGYWHANESAVDAQLNLIRELASRARIVGGERVLDVGCGLGGSSMFLARNHGALVKGISLSPKQVAAATEEARRRGLDEVVSFEVQDAHDLDRHRERYDVIWVIECSEHLFDKPKFIQQCAQHLVPGGRLALCAWLVNERLTETQARTVEAVRSGMLCPTFGTLAQYVDWMADSGLTVQSAEDVTRQVERTWSFCRPVLSFPLVRTMIAAGNAKLRAFADSFQSIDEAYRTQAMSYGMFVAEKPFGQEAL